jgi:superfamily II DNA helicase RecQ
MTATAHARAPGRHHPHLGDMRVIAGDVTRPSLHLSALHVRNSDEKLGQLLATCRAEAGSGIVLPARALAARSFGAAAPSWIAADHYHAGWPTAMRRRTSSWTGGCA